MCSTVFLVSQGKLLVFCWKFSLLLSVAKKWICSPKIPTSEWSVFLTNVRTNNEVENWNGKIWREANQHALHLYDLMALLKKLSDRNVEKMRLAFTNTKKAKQWVIDRKIEDAMNKAKYQAALPLQSLYNQAKITCKDVMIYNPNSKDNGILSIQVS